MGIAEGKFGGRRGEGCGWAWIGERASVDGMVSRRQIDLEEE